MVATLLVIENAPSDPAARLGEWLAEAGLALHTVRPHRGEALPEQVDHGGVLIMGGPMGAGDDAEAPWLPAERELIRTLVRDQIPTLGVCLGHQLIAAACGGLVRTRSDGPEIGAQLIAKRSAAATDPLFGELAITPDVIQWHYDEVVELPPGAVQLASSPSCDNQAYRLGRLIWGIQFHIETTPQMVQAWADSNRSRLIELGYDLDRVLDRASAIQDDLLEAWQPFARRFAEVVADPAAVPARSGPVLATAGPVTDPAAIRAALAAELGAARVLPLPHVRGQD